MHQKGNMYHCTQAASQYDVNALDVPFLQSSRLLIQQQQLVLLKNFQGNEETWGIEEHMVR